MSLRRVEPRHRLKIGKKEVFNFQKVCRVHRRFFKYEAVKSSTQNWFVNEIPFEELDSAPRLLERIKNTDFLYRHRSGKKSVKQNGTPGSTSSSGPNASTASAQSSAAISTFIGNTRLDTEFEQKRFHDENRSNPIAGGSFNSDTNPTPGGSFNFGANCSNPTAGGSFNSGTNSGGKGNGRGLRSRIEQLSSNLQPTSGWPPFGLPPNYIPSIMPSNTKEATSSSVQFGLLPSSQAFPDMSRNNDVSNPNQLLSNSISSIQALPDMSQNNAASNSNQPLSTAAVRQLIDESHLDLVNLLTSHLTTVLNPIMVDTNAKYEQLIKRFDNLVGIDGEEDHNLDMVNNEVEHKVVDSDHSSGHGLGTGIPIPEHVRVVRRGENPENVLHHVRNTN
ncbi:hypothetical protein PIB30_048966 [Stylosanthes scabra]|uniref:Uncharacterized protein n=1 Tax=Stylosanthes scabra TaxID=79078 RepID=A0ABU6TGX8_9FABA|nr:hypothetical protein [Stylosanthes scabra]